MKLQAASSLAAVEEHHVLAAGALAEVLALVAASSGDQCDVPLDDEQQAALTGRAPPPESSFLLRATDGALAGYAQLLAEQGPSSGRSPSSRLVGQRAVAARSQSRRTATASLLAAVAGFARRQGSAVSFWARHAVAADGEAAALAGFRRSRTLQQLRRRAGAPWPPSWLGLEIATRPFRPGADEDAWIALNRRAFTALEDQGGWTADDLAERERQPWFDPGGFLLHEEGGRLAGFCWTKLHPPAPAARSRRLIGEIYVIGVDPELQGRRLGAALLRAGCARLEGDGAAEVMLYVDAGNGPARAMYAAAGFELHHEDHLYELAAEPS